MGLEIRRNASGTITKHWFGAYTDKNGKRVCVPMKTLIADRDNIPASLRDQGSPAFEESRRAALKELEDLKAEARMKGRDSGLVRHLIHAQTGKEFNDTAIARLPELVATMKGHKPCRSALWRNWRLSVVQGFTEWATAQGLQMTLAVTPEACERYIAEVAEAGASGRGLTDTTLRRMKAILGAVFDRALPDGCSNPWKSVFVHTREGSEEIHRKALSESEVGLLLDAAESDPLIHPLVLTALSTGLRRGDVCRLKWSSVNFKRGVIQVRTGKTGATSTIPILRGLLPYLQGWYAEREPGAEFVFPDAERMLRKNPDGLTYRIKKAFARAFAGPQDALQAAQDAPERVALADVLPDVLKAVGGAAMGQSKRDKLTDLLTRYAAGQSYRDIQAEVTVSRGGISGLLHEAERLSGLHFLPDQKAVRPGVKRDIQALTKQARGIGTRSASVYDWHCLRTSFVTSCLFGPAPMTVDQVKAITGHTTVEMVLRHYAQPGADQVRRTLEGALPERLTKGRGEPKQIGGRAAVARQGADVESLAAQLAGLSTADRERLAALLKVV
jgi:integrase